MATHTYQLIMSFDCANQFAQSIWHYQFDDAGFTTTKAAAQALINAFDAARRTSVRGCIPTDVKLISYKARQIQALGGFNAFLPITTTNAGTRAGGISASALNPVVIHYPLVPSQGRGKWFVPGVSESDIESGRYTTTYASAIEAILSTLFDPLTLTGGGSPTATFGWYSKSENAFRVPVSSHLSLDLGTQRRRMRPAG